MPQQITPNIYKITGDGNTYLYLKPESFLIDTSDHVDSEYIKQEV